MKETTAYRGEYLVIDCPYCGETHYLNVEDDYGEGEIPDSGRRMKCPKCEKMMLVTECYA